MPWWAVADHPFWSRLKYPRNIEQKYPSVCVGTRPYSETALAGLSDTSAETLRKPIPGIASKEPRRTLARNSNTEYTRPWLGVKSESYLLCTIESCGTRSDDANMMVAPRNAVQEEAAEERRRADRRHFPTSHINARSHETSFPYFGVFAQFIDIGKWSAHVWER